MTLPNPTDDELNRAFAEKVAGWLRAERLGKEVLYDPEGGHVLIGDTRCMPKFTESMDLVLPFLPYTKAEHWCGMAGERPCWRVSVENPTPATADDKTLPRAAVIALLRSHGVEVEFDK